MMMNKKRYASMFPHFASMGYDEKQEWLKCQSIEDLMILLDGFQRSPSTLLNDAWSKFIEALIKEKRAQLRDDKLKFLGID